ncbi:MAG: zinc-ribbon domain-containing protein [Bacteroidales bacterium]|nr:zinc-ribbon domain-containing protein [Bacteroidales bacterium]
MKKCPQCESENPSSANHCMKCGALLVEETHLSEEAKLLKKIQEIEVDNYLLKTLLNAWLNREKTQPFSERKVFEDVIANCLSKKPIDRSKSEKFLFDYIIRYTKNREVNSVAEKDLEELNQLNKDLMLEVENLRNTNKSLNASLNEKQNMLIQKEQILQKLEKEMGKKEEPQVCEKCGTMLPKTARFCKNCGYKINLEK